MSNIDLSTNDIKTPRDKRHILSHSCDGLQTFFDYVTYGCVPTITNEGYVMACDDWNRYPITHCPFCGITLTNKENMENTHVPTNQQ